MKKRIKKNNLSRARDKRHQMLKSLANSLIFYEKITTTPAKMRSLKMYLEKLITKAKRGTLHDRRLLIKNLGNEVAVKKMMEVYGPKYQQRPGGYLRATKVANRAGDNAAQVLVEFVK
ncbi:MAG TPA: 50S ribosomal protein L17 [bacterium]|nr:50S ribosomal protein L17 [bacterium]HPN67525.1 50S ribosomal protein L17 [bacterium]